MARTTLITVLISLFCSFSYSQLLIPIDDCLICEDPIDDPDPVISVSLSGPSSVNANDYDYYYVNVSGGSHTSSSYTVSGGTIVSQSRTSVRVRWTSVGSSRYIRVNARVSGNYYLRTRYVTVNPQVVPLSAGSISGTKTICYGASAGTLSNSTSASGGSGTLYYQWQYSTNNSSWTNISGATSSSYSPGNLTATRWYRRRAKRGSETKYTSSIKITVRADLNPGNTSGTQTIYCYGSSAGTLGNSASASGGTGSYSYQWQVSYNNSTWSNISGATGTTYSPDAITSTRWYRRRVYNSCGGYKYASPEKITVNPDLNAGSISGSTMICYNASAGTLGNTSTPSGGFGLYNIRWQYSTNNSTWYDIEGATDLTYSPGNLTATRYYRRSANSCSKTKYSNVVTISVLPNLQPGSINGQKTICSNESAGTLGNSTSASGGYGTPSYQWQYSTNNSTWNDISGATGTTYAPGNLTSTRWYRREANSCSQTKYSNVVSISITSNPTPGVITGGAALCSGETASALQNSTSATASIAYFWQKREAGGSWVDIPGATGTTYDTYAPGALTTSTDFRRGAGNYCSTVYSNVVSFTVNANTTTPTIDSDIFYTLDGPEIIRGAPSGDTWYWQGTDPNGESTANSDSNYPITNAGTYYLRSQDANGCWGPATAKTIVLTVQKPVPSIVGTTVRSVTLNWTGEGTETGFVIHRASTAGGSYTVIHTAEDTDRSFTDTGLTVGTDYFYRVQAVQNFAYSGSDILQVTTLAPNTDLSYTPQYNGNIAAIKWGDAVAQETEKLYTYHYDALNRFTTAHYTEGSSAGTIWNPGPTPNTGAYTVHDIIYDLNGNIESLTRNSPEGIMDDLSYVYEGNRLRSVTDIGDISLGFVDGHPDGNDYSYDANGNATQDLNKGITSITYNYLNLPEVVTKDGGGYIKYIYDATGKKLGQETYDENDVLQSKSDYLGEFVYQDDVLKSVQHEEGMIVPDEMDGGWEYQYNLKDHLGNTRVTFTTKPKTVEFTASFESERAAEEEALYYNVAESRVTFSAADANVDGGNEVTRINGSQPMGAGLALYVAPGDLLDMEVYGYYEGGSGYSTQSGINAIIGAVAGGFGGATGVGATEGQQGTFDALNSAITGVGLNGTSDDNVPAAFLNYMLFDEAMAMYQHGFVQISSAAGMDHEHMFLEDVLVEKEGLAYVWVSNESASLNWVYFDDMTVTLREGILVQQEDYYPLGLSFNGYKRYDPNYEGTYSTGGLGLKDLGFRQYDITTGRFHVVDPLAELQLGESPYQYAGNNPINNIDVLGLLKNKKDKEKRRKKKKVDRVDGKKNVINKPPKRPKVKKPKKKSKESKKSKKKSKKTNSSSGDEGEGSDESDDASEDDGSGGDDDDSSEDVFGPPLFKRDREERRQTAGSGRTPRFAAGLVTPKRSEHRVKKPNPTNLGKWHQKSQNATDKEQLRQELHRNQPYLQAVALERLGIWGLEGHPFHRQLKLSLKTVESEESFGSYGNEPQAVQEVLDAIKTANEEEETTLDLTALKKKYSGGVHRKRKVKINGKDVDITIIFDAGDVVIDPGLNFPGTHNDGRSSYDFDPEDGRYGLRIIVDPENAEDLENYLGINEESEIDQLLSDILPTDISEADRTKYETLLKTAKNDGGVNTNITPSDWVTDQTQDPDLTKPVKDASGDFVLDAKGKKTYKTKKRQCWTAAKMMLDNTSYSSGGSSEVYQMALEHKTNSELVHDQENTNEGIRNIWDHMEAGRPVQVGVHHEYKKGINWDKSTDHFVVLTKMKFDSQREEFYFEYYDPGTVSENKGTSANNKLYLTKEGSTYIVKALSTGNPALPIGKKYVVTHVRPNGDATFKSGVIYQPNLSSGTCSTIVCE
ncbi:MAG: RHS repeat-associated core domain-containing protein [Bacteroidota bacterium]